MASILDRVARENEATPTEIIRTAVAEMFIKYELMNTISDGLPIMDRSQPAIAPAPAKAERYRGDGRSDFAETQRVNRSNEARKASGKGGERLVDKTPVR